VRTATGHGPALWCLGWVSVGSVRVCGSSTIRCRVAGGGLGSSTNQWLCPWEYVVAGAGLTGGKIGSGTAGASSRTAPPPGLAAVLLARTPTADFGCRPVDPVGPWLTGVRANQSTSARHAGCNPPSQLGDIRRHPRDATSDAVTVL
jgi:hypothetical protein